LKNDAIDVVGAAQRTHSRTFSGVHAGLGPARTERLIVEDARRDDLVPPERFFSSC
jgi:hypothetical protein